MNARARHLDALAIVHQVGYSAGDMDLSNITSLTPDEKLDWLAESWGIEVKVLPEEDP